MTWRLYQDEGTVSAKVEKSERLWSALENKNNSVYVNRAGSKNI